MKNPPKIIAISGVKNSGKTTLMVQLISAFSKKGYHVASIKHDAHHFVADTPNTDSYKHKQAGAFASFIFDKEKVQMVRSDHIDLPWLIDQLQEADIIFLEGAKDLDFPRIEVVRKGNSSHPVTSPEKLLALATDLPLTLNATIVDINDIDALVNLIEDKIMQS